MHFSLSNGGKGETLQNPEVSCKVYPLWELQKAAFSATEVSYCVTRFCRASGLLPQVAGAAGLLGEGTGGLISHFFSLPHPTKPFSFQCLKEAALNIRHPSTLLGFAQGTTPTWGLTTGNRDGCISTSRHISSQLERSTGGASRATSFTPKSRGKELVGQIYEPHR